MNKLGRSAAAKIKVKNKIVECAKNIAGKLIILNLYLMRYFLDLPYQNNEKKTLLTEKEFEEFMKKANDEDYKWNNYYQDYKLGD